MKTQSVVLSFLEQGFASLGTLAMSLSLIAAATPAVFGQFAFIMTLVLIAASLRYGLIGVPILVEVRPLEVEARTAALDSLLALDLYYRIATSLIVALAATQVTSDPKVIAAAAAFAFIYLWRESARNTMFALDRAVEAALIGATALVLLIALLALLLRLEPTPFAPLAAFAAANAVVMAYRAGGALRWPAPPLEAVRRYRQRFPSTGWSLLNSAANEFQTRYHVFAVEHFRGVDQLGILEAARTLYAPLFLAAGAWQRVALPQISCHMAAGEMKRARRLTLAGLALLVAVAALYSGIVYLAYDLISTRLFSGRYGDLAPYVIGWAVYSVLILANWALVGYLNSARAYRQVAMLTVGAALATVILMLGLAFDVPLGFALAAIVGVQAAVLACLLTLVWLVAPAPETGVQGA
jgi:O-antigen/teichoic acid export membrane protein